MKRSGFVYITNKNPLSSMFMKKGDLLRKIFI